MALNPGMLRLAGRAGLALFLASAAARAADPLPMPPPGPTAPTITEVGGKTLKEWVADLKHADPSVREEAIRAISLFGPAASEAVPALVEHVNDFDASPRCKAILTLGLVKIEDKDRQKVVEALGQRLLEESQSPIRYNLALVLGGMGKDARKALPGLLHGAEDASCFDVRRICLAVLVQAGQTDRGPDPGATHALLAAVTDRAAAVRLQGIMGLGQMGPSADPSLLAHEIQVLHNVMSDKDKTVVIWAHLSTMALAGKADKEDVDYLLSCANTGEAQRVRVQAARALGSVGKRDGRAVPRLVELMGEKDNPEMIASACIGLGAVEDPGKDAEAALNEAALNAALPLETRVQAVAAMAAIAGKARRVVPLLVGLLQDKDPNIVVYACMALGQIGDPGPLAEDALTALSRNAKAEEAETKAAKDALDAIHKAAKMK